MADWILENWQFDQNTGQDRWMTSGPSDQLRKNGKAAFGVNISDIEKAQI